MNSKDEYRQLTFKIDIPVYLSEEWLNCFNSYGYEWDVLFSKNEKNELVGFWVYAYKRQFLWKRIVMPPFTPYMGPRIFYPSPMKEYERISFENKVLEDLISQLPPFADIHFKWTREYTNWLAFYWNGFRQQTTYTYLLKPTESLDVLYSGIKDNMQRQIKKAQKNVEVTRVGSSEGVIKMFQESMSKQVDFVVDTNLLNQLHQIAFSKKQGMILEARDTFGKLLAAIYLLIDQKELLYLYGGYSRQDRDSGAMSLLFWNALQMASQMKLAFNFEGSMLRGVEKFFRSFGAKQTPVFTIQKSKFPFNLLQ